jgi:predicted protein tyrosine phosphatase
MITFLAVCGVNEVPQLAQYNIIDIVSIGDVGSFGPDLSGFPNTKVHRFGFTDISSPSEFGPQRDHVQRLITLTDNLLARQEDVRLLFHCAAGISRSTASAFICMVRAGMTYEQAYGHILRSRGFLAPNLLMIKYADDLLGHEGKMLEFIVNNRLTNRDDAVAWVNNRGWEAK